MNTTFSEREWKQREQTLGDPAERAFQAWCKRKQHKHATFGLRRPDVDLSMVPPFVRYTPDFLTQFGLVEVQGCGRDATFKFKHDKMEALAMWADNSRADGFNLYFFLWNQVIDDAVLLHYQQVADLCTGSDGWREDGLFDGHKPFSCVKWNNLSGKFHSHVADGAVA